MGVKQLWQILEEVGETLPVQRCAGQRVAVDLGSWIGQSRAVAQAAAISTLTSLTRVVFHRTLNLMRLGLQLVIVVDGRAPEVKAATLRQRSGAGDASVERKHFAELATECCGLFKALGLPVVWSSGEAEKLCAQLNQQGKVDACLTDDGDALLYGAETVYRNFLHKGKDFQWTRISMAEVRDKLSLERQDLVVLAILGGCDYDLCGIPGVGPEQTRRLITEIKTHHSNALERLQSWSADEELAGLARVHGELSTLKKDKHCGLCCHPGDQKVHATGGCVPCGTSQGCRQDPSQLCPCSHHQKERQVKPFQLELKIRAKALSKDPNFPDSRVIKEFMEEGEEPPSFSWNAVDIEGVVKWAQRIKSMTQADVRMKILEMLALTTCLRTGLGPYLSPVRIRRACKENFTSCFEVEWKSDKQDGINVKVPKDAFSRHSPNMVETFEKSQNQAMKGKKRTRQDLDGDPTQTTVTDFFKVTKKVDMPPGKK